MDTEDLSALVADIYDAALDPPSWRKVLKGVCGFVRRQSVAPACSGRTRSSGPARPTMSGAASRATSASTGTSMSRSTHSPPRRAISRSRGSTAPPTSCRCAVRRNAVLQGVDAAAGLGRRPLGQSRQVDHQPRGVLGRAACRDGMVDDDMRRRMRLLVPHVRRSAMIGKLIDLEPGRGRRYGRHARRPACRHVPGRRGRPAGARQCERPRDAERGQRAACRTASWWRSSPQDDALRDILLAASNGDAALSGKDIAVRLTARDGEQFVTHVLPLTAGAPPGRRVLRGGGGGIRAEGGPGPLAGAGAAGAAIRADPRRSAGAGRDHGLRRRRRGRVRDEALARDGAHASAPRVREDRRAAAGRPGQADDQLPGARSWRTRRGAATS